MNRFIQSFDGTILFRMSPGAEFYQEGEGHFEVRYAKEKSASFSTLVDAFLFYFLLDEAADLWDATAKPVLIESKIQLFLN